MAYSYIRYTGNGSTTNYTFNFPYLDQAHIKVRLNGTLTTLFTFLNASTIQLTSAPASGVVIEIRRETPKDNPIVNFTDGSVLLERDLDLLVTYDLYLAQETADVAGAVISQDSLGVWQAQNKRIANVADPVSAQDAVTKNYFDSVYTPQLDAKVTAAAGSATAAASSASSAATSAATAGTQASNASTSATNAANSATAAASSASSASSSAGTATTQANTATTQAGNAASSASAAATSASNSATSATSAANSASSASTSATNAATSATNAGNSAVSAGNSATSAAASASTATTQASNASASAANTAALLASFRSVFLGAFASDSAAVTFAGANSISIVAGIMYENTTVNKFRIYSGTAWGDYDSSAQASQSAAALSAANAASSASTASTQATNAANSATSAATQATNAANSATAAASSATSASNSASTATSQASAASTSASNAATSATNAATSATNASNSYNTFRNQYQGAYATAPTTRPDSSALQIGDLYFNTTTNSMQVRGSSGWTNAGSSVNGTARRYRYIATAGQTTFTGSDSNGNTMAYDAGYIDVYLNGIRLDQTDYTASSGTSIVLSSGAAVNDELNIIAFGTFSVAAFDGSGLNNASVSPNKLTTGAPAWDSSGNLGVGNSSPAAHIHITQNDPNVTARFQNIAAGGGVWDLLSTSTANSDVYGGKFAIRDSNVAGAAGYRLVIDSGGNWKLGSSTGVLQNSSGRPMLNQSGGVLQVVSASLTGSVSTSSTSMIDTGLSATITPSSTSSKILVLVTLNQISCDNASLSLFAIVRGSTAIVYNTSGGNAQTYQAFATGGGQAQNRQINAGSLTYLDSPASTAAQTYKVRIANNGGGTAYLNQWGLNTDAGGVSTITLMEIAG